MMFRALVQKVHRTHLFPGNWLWYSIGTIAIIEGVWIAVSERLSIAQGPLALLAANAVLALVIGLRRSRLKPGLREGAVGAAFILLAFGTLKIFDYLLMSLGLPLADDLLDSLDRALGLDWLAYATALGQRDWTAQGLRVVYLSLSQLTVIVFVALFWFRGGARAAEYVRLFFTCAAVSTVVGTFFPCIGVMVRYGSPELAAAFGPGAGTYYIPPLEALRSLAPYEIDLRNMPGLVEFPSFHTASAVLLAYVCRDFGRMSWVTTSYAVLLIASTPLMGGHYFVDLIAGSAVALAAIAIERRASAVKARRPLQPISVSAE